MPTFSTMSRRENGKLLERSILGLGSLQRTTLPGEIGKRLEIVPFVVVWTSLRWRERIDGTIGTYPATLSNSGYNSAPYWGTSYYCCRRVLGWLLESLRGWKRSCFNPDFNPRNFCALVNDLEWGGKLLPIIFTNIGILFWKIPNFTPK